MKLYLPSCETSSEFKKWIANNMSNDYYAYLRQEHLKAGVSKDNNDGIVLTGAVHPEIPTQIDVSKLPASIRSSLTNIPENNKLELNMKFAKDYCLIVYGNPENIKLKGTDGGIQTFRDSKGYYTKMQVKDDLTTERQPLFLGVTMDGKRFFPNSLSPEWFASSNAINELPWAFEPWNDSKIYNDSRFASVKPVSPGAKLNDEEYLYSLTKSVDKYSSSDKNDGLGNFINVIKGSSMGYKWVSSQAANADRPSETTYKYTDKSVYLSHYASVFAERSDDDWFPGAFNMYFIDKSNRAGYATFLMLPNPPFVTPNDNYDHEAVCTFLEIDSKYPAVEGGIMKVKIKDNITSIGSSPTSVMTKWNTAKTVNPVTAGLYENWMGEAQKATQSIPAGISVDFRWANTGTGTDTGGYYYRTYGLVSNMNGSNLFELSKADRINSSNGYLNKDIQVYYPKPGADGTATLWININNLRNHYFYPSLYGKPQTEADEANNRCAISVPIKTKQDASVTLDGSDDPENPTIAAPEAYLNGVSYTVSNNMSDSINMPCSTTGAIKCLNATDRNFKLVVTNTDTNEVLKLPDEYVAQPTGKMTPKTIAKDKTLTETLDKLKLPRGKYKIEVYIPRYAGEDDAKETDIKKTNNYDVIYVDASQPVLPENAKCDKYMKTGTVIEQNLVKMCYGYYPNHPSNETEGGIGTYMAFKYFFFPTPLPNYDIKNGGTQNQSVSASDPKAQAGSCEPGKTTDCDDLETFFYYPTVRVCDPATVSKSDCVSSLPSTYNPKMLKGPYTAGAHSFFHYLYRGRMIAESVQFNFAVYDVAGNVIATNNPEGATAVGRFVYNIPNGIEKTSDKGKYVSRDSLPAGNTGASDLAASVPAGYTYKAENDCFRQDIIDYKDACRSITFYLPNSSKTMFDTPEEKDKLTFLNVGTHSFSLEAIENQKYYYQHDDGNEYQGSRTNPSTLPSGWTAPHLTNAIDSTNQKYTEQKVNNHCEKLTDGFGVVTSTKCFHDDDKEFQYWLYNWSRVYRYDKDFLATW